MNANSSSAVLLTSSSMTADGTLFLVRYATCSARYSSDHASSLPTSLRTITSPIVMSARPIASQSRIAILRLVGFAQRADDALDASEIVIAAMRQRRPQQTPSQLVVVTPAGV